MVESLRMDFTKIAPDVYKHLLEIEGLIAGHVDKMLLHLIKMRSSQINGCAYCIGMHTDEALRDGEKAERLLMLDAWEESDLFDERERAVLEWVEEITLIAESHAHKDSFDALKAHFSDDEIGWLTLAASLINTWNRIAISSRAQYHAAHRTAETAKAPQPA
jgi:AhpD family alkylhydroperoxidase